jgi:hypothetical protein
MEPALKLLNKLAFQEIKRKYPSVPYPPPADYGDKTANQLTRSIIKFLQLHGHQAERISVTGRSIDRRKVVSDCMGSRRVIGSLQWINPTMTPGTADISATINGRSVKVEVKIGRDKQSSKQMEYQKRIEEAGGVYVIARNFDQFYQWYITTFKK